MYGGDGDDYLYDFHPGDQMFGGDGTDRLVGAEGLTMTVGAGDDLFELWASEMPPEGEATVLTDFVAGEDEIAIFMPPGEWLDKMQTTTEVVNGSTVMSIVFDETAAAFPQGYDNDVLSLAASEDFSFDLQGVTEFDPAAIKLISGASGDLALRPLEDFGLVHGTSGDDLSDVYGPEYSHDYLFAGDGADTVIGGLWVNVSGGSDDDVVIHHLVADPAVDLPFHEQIFWGHTQAYGVEGNDLIVFEDDFLESFYGFDTHQIGGFEVGSDQLGLIIPQADAGDVEMTFGTEAYTDFGTATVTTPDRELTIVLRGLTEAPAPGAFQLFENEAAVLAGNCYGQV